MTSYMLDYVLRRPGQEDVFFKYFPDANDPLGDKRILAYRDPRGKECLQWAYIGWSPFPELKINVTGDGDSLKRKGIGTALYVLACMQEDNRIESDGRKRTSEGEDFSKAMREIDIEGIIDGVVPPEIVNLTRS